MNALCYKIVFSKRFGSLIAVGEHAKGQGKKAGTGTRTSRVAAETDSASGQHYLGLLQSICLSITLCLLTVDTSLAGTTAPANNALPTGHTVNAGQVAVSTNAASMTIKQASDKASINWQSFNIGKDATVNVVQKNSSSVLLNRIVGQDTSQIFGKLNANGQVILINPNGIVFGKVGSVTASAFTASTFGLSDKDFMSGLYKYKRQGSTSGITLEEGSSISTTGSGYVLLMGASVNNNGHISTQQGHVVMAAGEEISLPSSFVDSVNIPLSGKVRLELSPATLNTTIQNGPEGTIETHGGQVLMQASAIADAVASVTQSGLIDTSAHQAGGVTLLAEHGKILVNGTIKANSSDIANHGGDIIIGRDDETGALSKSTDVSAAKLESQKGFVETSGEHLIVDGIQIKAAQWLLDPTDITITSADAGMTSSGTNPITQAPNTSGTTSTVSASTLANSLSSGTSVIIKTTNANGTGNGDITVASNIAVTGTTDATLTLQAERDIVVNSNVSIARTGANKLNVVLNSDLDGNGAGAIVMNTGSSISSNGGNITLGGGTAGTGAGSAFGSAVNGHGISLNGSSISSGSGNVTLTGTSFTSGNSIWGVAMDGGATITTTSGDVNITAAGQTSGQFGYGMMIRGGAKITTGEGKVTVNATSSATGSSDALGIQIRTPGAITTSGGNISMTGISRGASGNYNTGIEFNGGSLIAGGTGTVTLLATGGSTGANSYGISGANVTTSGGAVSITSTSTNNVDIDAGTGTINTSGGNVTLTANSYAGGGTETINAGSGTVTLRNRTAGTLIDIGGTSADVTTGTLKLGVSSAELARITAANVVIGRNDATGSGNVTLNATNLGALGNTGANLSVLSGNDITISSAITKSTGTDATLTLDAVNGINVNAAVGATVTGAGKLNVAMTANGNTALAANSKGLVVSSTINANGGTVALTGKSKSSAGGSSNSAIRFGGASIIAETMTITGNQTGSNSATDANGIYLSGTNTFQSKTGTSTLTGTSNAIGNFGGGIFAADGSSTSFDSGSGQLKLSGLNSNTGYRGIRIGASVATAAINTKGNITFEDTGFQVMLRGQLTQQANTTVNFKGKGVSMYAGTTIVKAAGATGTTLNLDAQTVVIGDGGGAAALTADTINITGSTTTAVATGVQVIKASTITSSGMTTITASGPGTSLSSDADTSIAATGGLTVNINNAGTLASQVTGGTANAGGLTKLGAGTLTVGNSNTHKGTTLVSAGTLLLNNANALQNSTLDTGVSDTQQVSFGLTGANTYNIGGLQGSDAIALGANRVSVGANNSSTTYSGLLSGTGGLTKVGSGNLTLSGDSTNTGDYNANAGTLTLTAATNTYRNFTGVNVNINNGATVSIPNVTQGGFISSNVVWTFGSTGGGTLDINANFVNRGTNGNKFVTTGGATNTINGNINLDSVTNLAAPTFDVAQGSGSAGLIYTGVASNGSTTQGLTKTGAGTMVMTGNNDYKGPIAINGGTLQLGNGGTTGSLGTNTGAVTFANGSSLQVNRSDAVEIASAISGAGNLNQIGTGKLTLTANNSYTGTTNVSAGTLQVGSAGSTGTLGTGAVTLSNNANLNVIRDAATTISNNISGAGNVSATITGNTGNLTLDGTTNLSAGTFNATASKTITTNVGKHITAAGGVSLLGQGGVVLNGNITNNTSGAISITAGDGTKNSTAAVTAAQGVTITQNAAAAVTMTTDALGDLTVAKIVKGAGAGDVTVASGIKLAVGEAGGNIKTIEGNTITNSGTGKTLIYTGSAANTGVLKNIDATLASLFLTDNAGGIKNSASRTAFGAAGGGLSGGPKTQVLFREAVDLTTAINGVTLTKTYGDDLPTAADITNALSNANNAATTSKSFTAATLSASIAEVISDLVTHATLDAAVNANGRINANTTGYNYTESGGNYASDGSNSGIKLVVNQKDVSLTAISASNKTYDGSNAATIISGTITNTAGSETLQVSGEGTFTNKDAENGKTVTVSDVTTLTKSNGTGDWKNYNLTTTGTLTTSANISKKSVSLASITAADKVYDSTNIATITSGAITTGIGSETLLISGAGTFSSKDAAEGKTVTVADVTTLNKSNGTGDWNNYQLTTTGPLTTTATISKKAITLSGATATDKVYDQTNVATLANFGALTSGAVSASDNKVYSGDNVTASVSGATFGSKNVATDANGNVVSQAVTLQGLAISGADAKNYSVTDASNATATISKKAVTLNGAAASDKVYDQTNVATLTNSGSLTTGAASSTDNKVYSGDTVTASVTGATFGSKNVATDANGNVVSQAVTLQGLAISGADSKNYSVTDASNATATISKKAVTLSGATAANKVYDQTNLATLTNSGALTSGAVSASDNKVYSGDNVTASVSGATFGSKNVATETNGNVVSQAVTLQGLAISGTDAKNYTVTVASNATATISKKAVTLTGATAANKVYDQTNVATLTNSGSLTSGATTSSDNKVYAGDTVTASVSGATFGSKNVATDANGNVVSQAVTLQGLAISGTDAKNYTVTDASNATATISKKAVTLSGATAANKVYDQTNVATLTNSGSLTTGAASSTDNKVYSGDTVTASVSGATFGSKNVATDANGNVVAQAVTLQGLTISGTDAKNYSVTDASNATATISKKAVTLTGAAASDKVYDQTNVATLTNSGSLTSGATTSSDNKVYAGDTVTASVSGATFGSKNVATDANGNVVSQAVTLQGLAISGTDAKNYSVTDASNATATISKKAVTLTGVTGADKIYDQTNVATLNNSGSLTTGAASSTDNKVYSGDTVTASVLGATFGSKNVATDANGNVVSQAVTLQGLAISGADSKNYSVTDASNATATISKKAVTLTGATGADKIYDQTNVATLNNSGSLTTGAASSTDNKVYSGDTVTASVLGATFGSKNVATDANGNVVAQAVTLQGLAISGTDAKNYTVTDASNAKAEIKRKNIAPSFTQANKTFDGNTKANVALDSTATSQQIVTGDNVNVSFDVNSAAYDSPTAGTDKAVKISGITLTGRDANNYITKSTATTTKNTITAPLPGVPRAPIIPNNNVPKIATLSSAENPFKLAAKNDEPSDTCESTNLTSCTCVESATSAGVSICYQSK